MEVLIQKWKNMINTDKKIDNSEQYETNNAIDSNIKVNNNNNNKLTSNTNLNSHIKNKYNTSRNSSMSTNKKLFKDSCNNNFTFNSENSTSRNIINKNTLNLNNVKYSNNSLNSNNKKYNTLMFKKKDIDALENNNNYSSPFKKYNNKEYKDNSIIRKNSSSNKKLSNNSEDNWSFNPDTKTINAVNVKSNFDNNENLSINNSITEPNINNLQTKSNIQITEDNLNLKNNLYIINDNNKTCILPLINSLIKSINNNFVDSIEDSYTNIDIIDENLKLLLNKKLNEIKFSYEKQINISSSNTKKLENEKLVYYTKNNALEKALKDMEFKVKLAEKEKNKSKELNIKAQEAIEEINIHIKEKEVIIQ